jgi:hypothetical protein
VYLKCRDKVQDLDPLTEKENSLVPTYVLTQFLRYRLISCLPQFFRILFVRTLKSRSVFNSKSNWRDTSPTNFWYTSDHSQLLGDLWKVRSSMIWCVQERFSSGVGYFEPFFVSFDLISNHKSTVESFQQVFEVYYVSRTLNITEWSYLLLHVIFQNQFNIQTNKSTTYALRIIYSINILYIIYIINTYVVHLLAQINCTSCTVRTLK